MFESVNLVGCNFLSRKRHSHLVHVPTKLKFIKLLSEPVCFTISVQNVGLLVSISRAKNLYSMRKQFTLGNIEMKEFFQLKSMGFYVIRNKWHLTPYFNIKSNKLLEEVLARKLTFVLFQKWPSPSQPVIL